MKNKSILLYCSGIDDVLSGSSKVAGIQVQMSFWARTFAKHGWIVYTYTNKETRDFDGIHFIRKKVTWLERHKLLVLQEFIDAFLFILKTKCSLVITRGAQRNLYALQLSCSLFGSKLIFFSASDTDYELGKELIAGSRRNVLFYRRALTKCKYFVTQNDCQSTMLFQNYGKKSIILNNIWAFEESEFQSEKKYDAVWVANFRRLKRAEWFFNLAKELPQYKFAFVGGVNELDYYDQMKVASEALPNLDFLGGQSFEEVNLILQRSRLLVCTSEFEGFPNTFLQAWAYGVPVISTVNPSNVISDDNLGKMIYNKKELLEATILMLEDKDVYGRCVTDIREYFFEHHNADKAYEKIINYIEK